MNLEDVMVTEVTRTSENKHQMDIPAFATKKVEFIDAIKWWLPEDRGHWSKITTFNHVEGFNSRICCRGWKDASVVKSLAALPFSAPTGYSSQL